MRPEHLSGIQDRARLFTKKCVDSPLGYADVYVRDLLSRPAICGG
jgi:hypothetical protein